jgi:hypothetical protein
MAWQGTGMDVAWEPHGMSKLALRGSGSDRVYTAITKRVNSAITNDANTAITEAVKNR